MRWRSWATGLVAVGAVAGGLGGWTAQASDHDDGENDNKARSLNITDVYAFREDWQTGNVADEDNLIIVMNTNPRSLARQPYYFSTNARYEVHVTRVPDVDIAPTGLDDVVLRLTFGAPDATTQEQPITLTWVEGTTETVATGTATTTNLADSTAGTLDNDALTVNGETLTVFAGLREDPFFFDVEGFFRTRGTGAVAVRGTADAVDFTAGYNVNSIVLRVPISALAGAGAASTFDVWTTVSIPMLVQES